MSDPEQKIAELEARLEKIEPLVEELAIEKRRMDAARQTLKDSIHNPSEKEIEARKRYHASRASFLGPLPFNQNTLKSVKFGKRNKLKSVRGDRR